MVRIAAHEVKKNNSNLFRYSTELFKAMRKVNYDSRFMTQTLDRWYQYLLASGTGYADPYPDCDFKMDLESFHSRLPPDRQKLLELFMLGLTPTEISKIIGRSAPNTYFKLSRLKQDFKKFYLGDQ